MDALKVLVYKNWKIVFFVSVNEGSFPCRLIVTFIEGDPFFKHSLTKGFRIEGARAFVNCSATAGAEYFLALCEEWNTFHIEHEEREIQRLNECQTLTSFINAYK
jgi:hypothetical protein